MKKLVYILFVLIACSCFSQPSGSGLYQGSQYYYYITAAKNLKFCFRNEQGENYHSISNLKQAIESKGKELLFAMNGGMYNPNGRPTGLYVENGFTIKKLNVVACGKTNFSMCFGTEATNGVFVITHTGIASIVKSTQYVTNNVKYATQSGPLLLYEGEINPKFSRTSVNYNLRNGVGIMPNGQVVMVLAENITLYNFASIFKEKFQCQNALYLDGAISQMYIENEDRKDLGGNFGVIIFEEK